MDKQSTTDKALAAYLGFACGDALGATVEFMTPRQIRQRHGLHADMIGGGWLGLSPGQVTDDSQMSLAVGRALIEKGTFDAETVAGHFVRWMDGEPPDIGNTCLRSLNRVKKQGILFGPMREDDAGNGALMRNLPVTLATLNEPDKFEDWTLQQCHITHHHHLSDAATLALGLMTRALLADDIRQCENIAEHLLHRYPEFAYSPYPGKASGYIVHTVQTVFHYFFNSEDFESCLIGTVNQGDDADTTGALAGMLAGARYGLDAIPERWLSSLEKGVSDEIKDQTVRLLRLNDSAV